MLNAKAQLTDQRRRDLDHATIREDIVSRTFLCPIVQEVVCKVRYQRLAGLRYEPRQLCNGTLVVIKLIRSNWGCLA